ncbi:Hypothetical predicted protein [Olea europaea subsp. europaea]|uniref:Uncharacterized protein n=1 Tax=Olea europaea subsp. europaea TaxID=158383 RepID=A0A8S0S194_OLEEU|nr:Hypothetical predicted protein [Olea europaea subsp. europaea]
MVVTLYSITTLPFIATSINDAATNSQQPSMPAALVRATPPSSIVGVLNGSSTFEEIEWRENKREKGEM